VWAALVSGFGGMRDHAQRLSLDPRLPDPWESLTFRITWRGSRLRVRLTRDHLELRVEDGRETVPVLVRGDEHVVGSDPVVVPLADQGPRIHGVLPKIPRTGGRRADGSRITAGVPDPIPFEEMEHLEPAVPDAVAD